LFKGKVAGADVSDSTLEIAAATLEYAAAATSTLGSVDVQGECQLTHSWCWPTVKLRIFYKEQRLHATQDYSLFLREMHTINALVYLIIALMIRHRCILCDPRRRLPPIKMSGGLPMKWQQRMMGAT